MMLGCKRRTRLGEQRVLVRRVIDDLVGPVRQLRLEVHNGQHFDAAGLQRLHRLIAGELGGQRTARAFRIGMASSPFPLPM